MALTDGEVAVAAVEAGAAIVRARFRSELVLYGKAGGDLATDVDLAAEAAIRAVIHWARPADAVVGEEAGASGGSGNGRTWLVDPLCGTLNYAAGTPGVAVNVALRAPEGLTAAAVADPLADEVLWTEGAAAFLRRDSVDEPARPSASSGLVDLNLDAPFPSAPAFRCVDLLAHPEFRARFRPRVMSSSLALAWVASGQRAAYVTDGEVGDSVHFAAGIALCLAAGCVLSDLEGRAWTTGARGLVAAADSQTSAALVALIDGR